MEVIQMINVTAADIGFNYVKGLVSTSDRRAFFPSVVVTVRGNLLNGKRADCPLDGDG
jgi:hypothetical protein